MVLWLWNEDIFNFCSWYRLLSACCLTSSGEQRIESFCCLKMFLSLCFAERYLAILGCNHLDQHSHLHLPPHYWNYTRNLIINWNVVFVAQLAQTAELGLKEISTTSLGTELEIHILKFLFCLLESLDWIRKKDFNFWSLNKVLSRVQN